MTARPASAMPGHAIALQIRHARQDRRDAHAMRVFLGLRESTTSSARMLLLSGLAGFRRNAT